MATSRRSRGEANRVALEKLSVPLVSDDDILVVLRKWCFKSKRGEPISADTLGTIRSPAGKISFCRTTKKHPAVFALLCRWLEDNLPHEFQIPFHFTSVRIGHGGQTTPQRDQWCLGPAMTKSFGRFAGGQLIYWGQDDGTMDVTTADATRAQFFDTRREMVLFDPSRCHRVETFDGERYFLMYFTTAGYEKLTNEKRKTLVSIGSVWPDQLSTKYWDDLLGPATGQCKNIRVLLGYEAKPSAIQPSRGAPFINLGTEVVAITFSFIISPALMSVLCACSITCNQACNEALAWDSTMVETDRIRPQGNKAHFHWKLWKTAFVINGRWADKNVGVLLCKEIRQWRFVCIARCLGLKVSISSFLETPSVSFHYKDLCRVFVAFSTSQNADAILDAYVTACPLGLCTPFVQIGGCRGCLGCADRSSSGIATLSLVGSCFGMRGGHNLSSFDMSECVLGSLALGQSEAFSYFVVIGEHNFRPCWERCE